MGALDILTDMVYPDGQDNMAGVAKDAFIGIVSDFATIAKPIAVPVAIGDGVKIVTAHVLKATKKTFKFFVMYEKSGVESPMVGQRKSKSWKPKFKLFYPGGDAVAMDILSLLQNVDIIAWATPLDGVGLLQIGSEELPATIVAGSVKTGEGPEGEKGISFEVEAPSRKPYYLYTAALPRLGA